MNNLLVTGSSGFIAKNLLPKLSEEHYEVTKINSKSGDIYVMKIWTNIPKNDTVIHLAGVTYVPHSWNNPSLFLKLTF